MGEEKPTEEGDSGREGEHGPDSTASRDEREEAGAGGVARGAQAVLLAALVSQEAGVYWGDREAHVSCPKSE